MSLSFLGFRPYLSYGSCQEVCTRHASDTASSTANIGILTGYDTSSQQGAIEEGKNLVTNPDFEVGGGIQQPGWTAYRRFDGSVMDTAVDSRLARSGVKCVKIEQVIRGQGNFAAWIQKVSVEPEKTYRYSFWVKTENVKPSISSPDGYPDAGANGYVEFWTLKEERLPLWEYGSCQVQMTHDWKRFEISFKTPAGIAYVKLHLSLRNAIGLAYFDCVSLTVSSFEKVVSPPWLSSLVMYELGPHQFLKFGGGRAFRGIVSKLPELKALGVNALYMLPIWEDKGGYTITDHLSIFSGYGTSDEFKQLVEEAHRLDVKVVMDLAGTIGLSPKSELVHRHPEWLVLNENNTIHYGWGPWMLGLDCHRPDVQRYFVDVARYYVEKFDVDGYRCDCAFLLPYDMFEAIRHAIQQLKPEAIIISEGEGPIYHEKGFDVTYDWKFLRLCPLLRSNSREASKLGRWLAERSESYPTDAIRLRYLEGHDERETAVSKFGSDGSKAFATLLFTIEGIPMIYNGQEVGNIVPQYGTAASTIYWENPKAEDFRRFYTRLIHIRSSHQALRLGRTAAVDCSDERVAAFARFMSGSDPIICAINFSDSTLECTLSLPVEEMRLQGNRTFFLVDLLTGRRDEVSASSFRSLKVSLEPYGARICLMARSPAQAYAFSLISEAEDALRKAQMEGRTVGLLEAKQKLGEAIDAYATGRYEESIFLAEEAKTLADRVKPPHTTTSTVVIELREHPQEILQVIAMAAAIVVSGFLAYWYVRFHSRRLVTTRSR